MLPSVIVGVALLSLLAPLREGRAPAGDPPPEAWRPPPLPVTVSYAWRDVCVYRGPQSRFPQRPLACPAWRLAVWTRGTARVGTPMGESGRLQQIVIPDAPGALRDDQGELPFNAHFGLPFAVSPDGRRIAYFSAVESRFVAHDLPGGRRVRLAPRTEVPAYDQEFFDLDVSADGRFFSTAFLKGRPRIRLTDFTTGRTRVLKDVCEVLSLGRDARRIIGVPCSGSPYDRYGVRFTVAVFDGQGVRIGGLPRRFWKRTGEILPDGGRIAESYHGKPSGPGGLPPGACSPRSLVVESPVPGRVRRVVRLPCFTGALRWGAVVGDRMLLEHSRSGKREMYQVDLSTGVTRQVIDPVPLGIPLHIVVGTPPTGPVVPPEVSPAS
ncbi:hypothetical protein GCM10010156_45710 [Planobispora rosea]|uniref:Uncharacterized protein n=1 Tax=Planobispora rosea TaxID=35762 RepID=A0A8J3S029_PLARO|nr:hypothetical protein [Planobispora rosea]GGS81841.1 hypothetical protein GCM10010156_45710 [Planobispora rosea]GIH86096.1 hypothetical protein Pro02_45040 [Planobispora rosea]